MTGSDRTLATTWATSVARLSPESRRLLERLAFLAPDPVPDSLLDVAVPGEAPDTDAYEARAGLYAYSLISRVDCRGRRRAGLRRASPRAGFRPPRDERRAPRRRLCAKRWNGSNAAFVGDPEDVRSWPILDPLAPHALAVARAADAAEIAEPTARLFNQLGVLFDAKAAYAQAEPLDAPRAGDRREELRPGSS